MLKGREAPEGVEEKNLGILKICKETQIIKKKS
jgi:hypothetical protein